VLESASIACAYDIPRIGALISIISIATSAYSYWTLHFDASPRTLRSLNGIMRRDPRVLRWTVLKLADRIEDISEEGLKVAANDSTVADIVD
jgi:small subunit ribosomal protein S6